MKKTLIAVCPVSLCVLFGCSQSSTTSQEQASDSSTSSTSQERSSVSDVSSASREQPSGSEASDSADSDVCEIPTGEMPEHDFGIDEAEYLVKTYGLSNADRTDLISSDQFAWLAQNRVRAVVAIADPEAGLSKNMVSLAQKGVNTAGGTAMVYVYEPKRDAPDGYWAKLTGELAKAGIANLEDVTPGRIVQMSKQTVDANGSPAPVTNVFTEVDDIEYSVADAFSLACCG